MADHLAIHSDRAPKAIGPYSIGVRCGDLIFCSGQIPIDPDAPNDPLPEDVGDQTRRVLENIRLLLEDQNLSMAHVIKTTVFMTDLNDFARMNEIYASYFQKPFPARSTVQVAALPKGALVEIEVVVKG